MKSLIIKDFLVLKRYARIYLLIFAFYIVLGTFVDDASLLSAWIIFILAMMVLTSLSYDEQSKWNTLALSMPIKRDDIVKSKYVLSLSLLTVGFLTSIISVIIINIVKQIPFTFNSIIMQCIMLLIGLLFTSLILPISFKYGTEKSRIVIVILFLVPFGAIMLIEKANLIDGNTLKNWMTYIMEHRSQAIAAIIIFAILIYAVSYLISKSIVRKTEY